MANESEQICMSWSLAILMLRVLFFFFFFWKYSNNQRSLVWGLGFFLHYWVKFHSCSQLKGMFPYFYLLLQAVLLQVIILWRYLVSGWLLNETIWLPSHLIRQNWTVWTAWIFPLFPLISLIQPPLTIFQYLANPTEAPTIFLRLYTFPENSEVDLLNSAFIFPLKNSILFNL